MLAAKRMSPCEPPVSTSLRLLTQRHTPPAHVVPFPYTVFVGAPDSSMLAVCAPPPLNRQPEHDYNKGSMHSSYIEVYPQKEMHT